MKSTRGKNKIEIEFKDEDELARILEQVMETEREDGGIDEE